MTTIGTVEWKVGAFMIVGDGYRQERFGRRGESDTTAGRCL